MAVTEIEKFDRKRMHLLELYVINVAVFVLLMLTRYFFRRSGMNSTPIGFMVLGGLLLSLILFIYITLRMAALGRQIKSNPRLREALDNELVQSLEIQSWKAGYFGAVGATVFYALVWFLYPVCDLVLVALTAVIAGLGAYRAAFYFKYKSL